MTLCKQLIIASLLLVNACATQAGLGDDLKSLWPGKKVEQQSDQEKLLRQEFEWCKSTEKEAATKQAVSELNEESNTTEIADTQKNALVEENERVVKCLIASLLRVSDAQANFAEALDAKDEADKLRAESAALSEAHYTDKSALKKHVKVSEATNKVIRTKISKKQTLSEAGRKQFSSGLLHYAIAIKETKEMTDAVGPYYDATKKEAKQVQQLYNQGKKKENIFGAIKDSLNYMKALFGKRFGTTEYLVKNGKGLVKDHKSTINSVVEYAKDNEIEIPPEVETELSFI